MLIQFQIFKPDNKFLHWNVNNVLFICFILTVCIGQIKFFEIFSGIVLVGIFLFFNFRMFTNYFRTKALYGEFVGILTFYEDSFQIDNRLYTINEIFKIMIRVNDYEGKFIGSFRLSPRAKLSNGTNNLLRVELKTGELKVIKFQIDSAYDYEKLQPFVLQLIANKLISIEDACKVLKCDDIMILKMIKLSE